MPDSRENLLSKFENPDTFGQPAAAEASLLDKELEEYHRDPSAGSPWPEVVARIRSQRRSSPR